jgi:hypothetical protein
LAKTDFAGSNCPVPACVPTGLGCTICSKDNKNRPSSLTFLYTAGQGRNSNNQGSKAYGDLTATYPAATSLSLDGFSAQVSDGETFTVSGGFDANSCFSIGSREVCFHTSCSVDLVTGDVYGPLTVLGGGSCAAKICNAPPPPSPPSVTPAVTPSPVYATETQSTLKSVVCNDCGTPFLFSCIPTNPACTNYGTVCPAKTCNDNDNTPAPTENSGWSWANRNLNAGRTCAEGTDACLQAGAKLTSLTLEYIQMTIPSIVKVTNAGKVRYLTNPLWLHEHTGPKFMVGVSFVLVDPPPFFFPFFLVDLLRFSLRCEPTFSLRVSDSLNAKWLVVLV